MAPEESSRNGEVLQESGAKTDAEKMRTVVSAYYFCVRICAFSRLNSLGIRKRSIYEKTHPGRKAADVYPQAALSLRGRRFGRGSNCWCRASEKGLPLPGLSAVASGFAVREK